LKSAPLWYRSQSRASHQPARKALFGAIHVVLELQKIYRYAGWFRIEDYQGQGYGAYLSPSTLKVWPTERLLRKGENKSIAAISNTCYNFTSVTSSTYHL